MKLKNIAAAFALIAVTSSAMAAAIHDAALFTDNTLARNDDQSTGLVNIGFTTNFFGTSHTQLYVNNNGNVTFNAALSTFTPFGLTTSTIPIIAPFFADVDTRSGPGITQYGTDTIGGRSVFGVNWINVGYYSNGADKLNSFQLILTDRSDIGAGDFDIEVNYDQIQWETGGASGGSGGLGGTSAVVGYTDGGTNDVEFAGSRVNGAFLDNGPNALIGGSRNSNTLGQYIFFVRNGQVEPPNGVPEPGSLALAGLALAGLGFVRRRRAVK